MEAFMDVCESFDAPFETIECGPDLAHHPVSKPQMVAYFSAQRERLLGCDGPGRPV